MLFNLKILGNLDHLINQVAKVALSTTEESCQLFCSMFADWLKSASVAVDHSRLVFDLHVFEDFFRPDLSQEQSTRNTEKKNGFEIFSHNSQKTIPSIHRVSQFNKKTFCKHFP